MRIALVTPARPGTRNGNRHTALRWAAFLRQAGHRVSVLTQWNSSPPESELLLALHARRSHASISAFARACPGKPIVLALTGTDVYRDIHISPEARKSLELAQRLIVLQAKAIEELPRSLRSNARVVVQSSATRLRQRPVRKRVRFCVVGNLRTEKDPLRALYALRLLDNPTIELVQIGEGLEPALAAEAQAAMRTEPRYRWLGGVPHPRAMAWLASSHAMVISSRMEGGANVVCEALRIGVPVLASAISGNIGLLGARYPGYFPLGNERTLAALMKGIAEDSRRYAMLKRQVSRLRPTVSPAREKSALLSALAE